MLRILYLLLMIITATNVNAEDISIYQAEIDIDATASSASLAREKAMTEANRKALYAITNRISTATSTTILDNLNDNQILNFIQEVSVLSEKVTDSRYIATLKITINAPILKAYLSEKNAPIAILPKTHIIIVPVYKKEPTSTPLLWEDNNEWYKAWENNTLETGQITLSPISRNIENISYLSVEKAISLDSLSLEKALRNSNGNEIYVAEINSQNDEFIAILKSPKHGLIKSKKYASTPDTFETIINDMKSSILQQIQQQTIAKEQSLKDMTIIFGYKNLSEWIHLKKIIKNNNSIQKLNIDAIGNNRVQITVNYKGDSLAIENYLNKQGYTLHDKGNFYIIERYY